jgi:hypothetical protein
LTHPVAHSQEGFEMEKILDVRKDMKTQRFELLVKWRGLAEEENTWEPVTQLFADVRAPLVTLPPSE